MNNKASEIAAPATQHLLPNVITLHVQERKEIKHGPSKLGDLLTQFT